MLEWCNHDRVLIVWDEKSSSVVSVYFQDVTMTFDFLYLQDSRSEHERQYLFSQGHGLAENTELIKSPR